MIPFDPNNPVAGIYHDITIEEYHKGLPNIISKSYLVKFLECPAAAKEETNTTPDMLVGRAMHPLILEGFDAFSASFAVTPDFPCPPQYKPKGWKNRDEYKKLVDDWKTSVAGKEIITNEQYQKILGMKSGVLKNPKAAKWIERSQPEVTLIWQDKDTVLPDGRVLEGTGIWCKSRPDLMDYEEEKFADLKKSQKVLAHGFQATMLKFGYHIQAGMAFEGMYQITGKKWNGFTMIPVRDKPPYQCEVHPLEMQWIERGYSEFKRLLRLEAQCREQDFWPNFTPKSWENVREPKDEELLVPGYATEAGIPWELQEGG